MKIERFEVPGLAQYSYVVSDGGEAVVIDPIRDVGRYLEYAEAHGLTIQAVMETHIHADFAAGSCELAARTGAELVLSGYDDGERYVYAMPHRALRDGDAVRVGSVELRAMHTPGHTPEHLSFLLYEAVGERPSAMFSGDFLFVGSLGRPDLLGQDAKVALAHALFGSVQAMKALPDGVRVYPGHGAGSFCGAGMSEAAETTLGAERMSNPFFRLEEEAFVAEILASVPELPTYYPRMKALNAAGAKAMDAAVGSAAVPVERVAELMQETDVTLLDVRSVVAFAAGHVPGSLHLAGASFALWAGWLVDAASRLVLVTEGGDEPEARVALARVGLDAVLGHLEGGVAAWMAEGMPVRLTPARTVDTVWRALGDVLVLDVRNAQERSHGSIAGSVHVTLGDLPMAMVGLERGREVVTVCESGLRASIAASVLERAGFSPISSMSGGMGVWVGAGLPVERS